MRRWCFLLPAVLLPMIMTDPPRAGFATGAVGGVVINEVYYDHPGADGGFEYVELFNAGPSTDACAGFVLEHVDGGTGTVRTLWIAPPGTAIEPGGFLLVGGVERDPAPGCELGGRLENGPDAVRLRRGTGEIDCIGYGGESLAPCEGRPVPGVPPGRSISRRPDGRDSGDNATDLVCADPTPGRPNFHAIDCALGCRTDAVLRCAGEPAALPLTIGNSGLERFVATATVRARWAGGWEECEVSRQLPVDLEPGETLDVPVMMHPEGEGEVIAVLSAAGDGDPLDDTARVCVRAFPGPVVVSEIMYRPAPGEGEWIELLSRTPAAVDLSGWSLRDAAGGCGVLPEGASIAAGGYLVVAQDPAGFSGRRPGCAAPVTGTVSGWPRLNDAGDVDPVDVVSLRDGAGLPVDVVPYRGLCGEERGRSIERVSADACGAGREGVMQRCQHPGGATPGAANSVDSPVRPGSGLLAEPEPFDPRRHGTVRITAAIGTGEWAFNAFVFDIDGVLVRRLAAGPSGAPVVSFLWDGLDGYGRTAPVGIYVCVVEFVVRGGGVCRRERCVITVGGS